MCLPHLTRIFTFFSNYENDVPNVVTDHIICESCGCANVSRLHRCHIWNSLLSSCFAPSSEISGVRTLGKSAKGAIHSLERGIVPVQTGGFLKIDGELGIIMCAFTFSSAMQVTPLVFGRQNVLVVWLSVGAFSACASSGFACGEIIVHCNLSWSFRTTSAATCLAVPNYDLVCDLVAFERAAARRATSSCSTA